MAWISAANQSARCPHLSMNPGTFTAGLISTGPSIFTLIPLKFPFVRVGTNASHFGLRDPMGAVSAASRRELAKPRNDALEVILMSGPFFNGLRMDLLRLG